MQSGALLRLLLVCNGKRSGTSAGGAPVAHVRAGGKTCARYINLTFDSHHDMINKDTQAPAFALCPAGSIP